MKLNKQHRESLIDCLEDTYKEIELTEAIMSKTKAKEKEMVEYYEVQHWLLMCKRDSIKKALSENEIDY